MRTIKLLEFWRSFLALCISLPILAASSVSASSTYDLSAQFGTNSNPNGPWSYGWKPSIQGSFSNYTTLTHPESDNGIVEDAWITFSGGSTVYYNPSSSNLSADGGQVVLPPGSVWFSPGASGGADKYGAIRFTVPTGASGDYSLAILVTPTIVGSLAGDTDFHVVTNGVEAFGVFLLPTQSAGYTNTFSLEAGGTIDIQIGRGADNSQAGALLTVQAEVDLVSSGLLTNPPPSTNVVYDLAADFSESANPNGVWSYGWEGTNRSAFTLYTSDGVAHGDNSVPYSYWITPGGSSLIEANLSAQTGLSDGGQGKYPPGSLWMAAGVPGEPDYFSTARFMVPAGRGGYYSVAASATPSIIGSLAGAYEFHVAHNGVDLYEESLGAKQSGSFSNSVILAAGDTVDFLVGRGTNATASGAEPFVNGTITYISSTNPAPPPATNALYDVSAQFGTNSNPNGAWSYGWKSSIEGSFSNYTTSAQVVTDNRVTADVWTTFPGGSSVFFNPSATTAVADGGQSHLPPGAVWFDPGADGAKDNYGAIRFTVPTGAPGQYILSTFVTPAIVGSSAGDSDLHIVTNGVEAFGLFLTPTESVGYTNTVALNAGDTVDFMIGRGADGHQSGSELIIQADLQLTSGGTVTNASGPPVIVTQPQSQSVTLGQLGTLSVAVTGTPPFSYQWYSGASGDVSNPIPGATNASFSPGDVFSSESFWVAVQNSLGGVNSMAGVLTPASLTPPTITVQPQSQSVTFGQTVTLSVTVTGTSPFSYQWYAGAAGNTSNPIPGATNASFSPGAVFSSESFWVAVQNSQGGVNSAAAVLTPASLTPPVITVQPQSQSVPFGQTVILSVTVTGSAPFTYQWYAGASGSLSNPIPGATNASFSPGPVLSNESFWVAVQNSAGSANSAAAILTAILTPPTITVQPQSQSVTVGQVVTLSVIVIGSPPYTYQWYAGASGNLSNPIPGATNASFSPGAVFSSESFWVSVQNPAGSVNSAAAVLTPVSLTPPTITMQPQSQSVTLGQVVTLSVIVIGSPPYTYQWYAGASGNLSNPIPGATNASFGAGSVFSSESFWVAVQNSQGGVNSASAVLTVIPATQSTLGLQIVGGLPFLNIAGLQGTSYRIQYSTDLATTNWTTLIQVTLPSGSFTFSDSGATNSARYYRAVTP